MARRLVIGFILAASLVILALAIGVLFDVVSPLSLHAVGALPDEVTAVVESSSSGASAARAVESDFDANEAMADSAPQQQVVAGWATKDALQALLRQSDVLSAQNADLSQQIADGTNSIVSLLVAIALALVAGCVLLAAIAVGVLWKATPAAALSSSAQSPEVVATAAVSA